MAKKATRSEELHNTFQKMGYLKHLLVAFIEISYNG